MSYSTQEFRCRHCNGFLESVATDAGGRVGWICHECELLYPEHHLDVDQNGPT